MTNTRFIILGLGLLVPAACSHDRRESETPEGLTPASGYEKEYPAPSTTNQPSQPGSPEPMNLPPDGQEAPDSRLSPTPANPGMAPLVAANGGSSPGAQPAHAGNHGKGGAGGRGGASAK